jgi:hypothetical protein
MVAHVAQHVDAEPAVVQQELVDAVHNVDAEPAAVQKDAAAHNAEHVVQKNDAARHHVVTHAVICDAVVVM